MILSGNLRLQFECSCDEIRLLSDPKKLLSPASVMLCLSFRLTLCVSGWYRVQFWHSYAHEALFLQFCCHFYKQNSYVHFCHNSKLCCHFYGIWRVSSGVNTFVCKNFWRTNESGVRMHMRYDTTIQYFDFNTFKSCYFAFQKDWEIYLKIAKVMDEAYYEYCSPSSPFSLLAFLYIFGFVPFPTNVRCTLFPTGMTINFCVFGKRWPKPIFPQSMGRAAESLRWQLFLLGQKYGPIPNWKALSPGPSACTSTPERNKSALSPLNIHRIYPSTTKSNIMTPTVKTILREEEILTCGPHMVTRLFWPS